MQGFGDDFLARAALALQEHGGAAVGDLGDEVKNLEHRLAFADDVFEVVALLEGALELDVFFFSAAPAHGGANVGEKLFVVPGFLDEIGGAGLHGAHRIFHRAVGGDHDHRQAGFVGANFGQNFHAVAAGQSEVEQDQVERMFADALQAGFAGARGFYREAFHLQQGLQRLANLGLIVNDEHGAGQAGRSVHQVARDHGGVRHILPRKKLPSGSVGNQG